MSNKESASIPNLESLRELVMRTDAGKLRISAKAKIILRPIFEQNGFDIETIQTVQQYETIQNIVTDRIACDLTNLADAAGAVSHDLEQLGLLDDGSTSVNISNAPTIRPSPDEGDTKPKFSLVKIGSDPDSRPE